jgi:WD40 repeat protein
LLDAFEGGLMHALDASAAGGSVKGAGLGCGFTPDGRSCFAGAADGTVLFWDLVGDPSAAGAQSSAWCPRLAAVLNGHVGPVGAVACSPTLEVLVSACRAVALWTDASTASGDAPAAGGEGVESQGDGGAYRTDDDAAMDGA